MTKRDELKKYLLKGEIKKALQIAKKLDDTYNKDEVRTLEIAYEVKTGKESFYKMLGISIENNLQTAITLLNRINV